MLVQLASYKQEASEKCAFLILNHELFVLIYLSLYF
jgi:hypothetical protein